MSKTIQKITPFLSFATEAEEAANFYVSIFPNSRIVSVTHYGKSGSEASGAPEGSVMTVSFELEGQEFVALNGGPESTSSLAISFVVNCETQEEVDALWERLMEGGEALACGWLRDRFGVPWQITPVALMQMIQDPDAVRVERAMKAMMTMVKLDIATLQRAYDGEDVA